MADDFIKKARQDVKTFFATATEDEIRQLREQCGEEIYSQGPSREILAFDAPEYMTTGALKYTDEKPTEPGWYFCKPPSGEVEINRVVRERGDMYVIRLGYWHDLRWQHFRYAGPIPEPED